MTVEEFLKKWERNEENEFGETYVSDFQLNMGRALGSPLMPELNQFIAECTIIILRENQNPLWVSESAEVELGNHRFDRDVSALLNTTGLLDQLNEKLTAKARHLLNIQNKSFSKPLLVIMTGAGFSKPFGVPITKELSLKCLEYCPDSAFNTWIRNEADWEDLKQRIPLSELKKEELKNIERVLTTWSGMVEQAHVLQQHLNNPHYCGQIENDYESFLWNLCYHLYKCGNAAADRALFSQFVDWLKEANRKYDVRFLTFNYDLILEKAIEKAGLKYTYLENLDAIEIPVRKLHGSINWRRSGVVNVGPPDLLFTYGNDTFYKDADLDKPSSMTSASGLVPQIIPPDARKRYEKLAQHVWQFAMGDLASNVEKLLIVGYSFPTLDFYASMMVSEYVQKLVEGGKEVMYVNPDCNACNYVGDLLELKPDQLKAECWNIDHFNNLLQ